MNRKRSLARCPLAQQRVRARRERRRTAGGIPPRGNNKQRMELWGLSKARPISCSVCPAFHRRQISVFCDRRKPKPFPWPHTTPPLKSRSYIRWCCIDLLRPPALPDMWIQVSGNGVNREWSDERTPLESSANSAVSLLEQEKHCQHAEEEKRKAQPCHVVHGTWGNPHQCQHHQKQNESDAATADNSVFRMAFKDAPEYERVEGKQPYASCRV